MDAKTQFLLTRFSEGEIKSIENGTYKKDEIHEFGLLPQDITFGIEFEHLLKPGDLPEMLAFLIKIQRISGIHTNWQDKIVYER